MIEITHVKDGYDIYIGRFNRSYNVKASPLANEFKITGGTSRLSAIEQYGTWLTLRITQRDPSVLKALCDILDYEKEHGTVRLGCWCTPEPCHGHSIADVLQQNWILEIIKNFREGVLNGSINSKGS